MGIEQDRSLTMAHDGEGTRDAYKSTSETISEARTEGSMSGYDDESSASRTRYLTPASNSLDRDLLFDLHRASMTDRN